MFVAPRPLLEDDPLFPVRVALMPVIGFVLGMILMSPMAMLYPTLMFSLTAGNRKAFDPKRALGAPIIFSLMLWIMSGFVALLHQTPSALVILMGLFYFLGFFMIQSRGDSVGMLIIVAAALMSIMGLGSYDSMSYMRAEMTKAALCTAVVGPVLYMLLPPATREINVDVYTPSPEKGRVARALIRAVVMLAFSLYLYTILDSGNVMLAIAGMFVLVFSTQEMVWGEAGRRSFAVMLGGGAALAILGILSVIGHLSVLLGMVFLFVLWCGWRMIAGRLPSPVYQDAASIMISMVGSALSTSDPAWAFLQRAGLTMIGAVLAASMVLWLDHIFSGGQGQTRSHS